MLDFYLKGSHWSILYLKLSALASRRTLVTIATAYCAVGRKLRSRQWNKDITIETRKGVWRREKNLDYQI